MSGWLSTALRGIKVKKKEQQKQDKDPKQKIARNNVESTKIETEISLGVYCCKLTLILARWPNRGRVSRSRIGSARTTTIKRRPEVMLGCHVPRCGTEWKFRVKARGPAIAAAVAVGTPKGGQVVLGKVHARVVPRVAVAAVPGLHGNQ